MLELQEIKNNSAKIKVIGVGGAGCNAVNNMVEGELQGVEFIVVNTDLQALESSLVNNKIQIGSELTKGLGAGANPNIGRQAALDDAEQLKEAIDGADMLFITAGMGGGTGTGASPIIGEIASEIGILTTAVVTKPFLFEGKKRGKNSLEGISELKKHVDAVIVIENNKLLNVVEPGTPIVETFSIANNILRYAVQGISDLILVPGLINLDFADVKTIMLQSGRAVMGIGRSKGENMAVEAAKMAISSPLLEETSINGATGVLINITGGPSLTLHDVDSASSLIHDSVHEDANIIFGAVIDHNLNEEVIVTVIATGFEEHLLSSEMPDFNESENDRKPVPQKKYDEHMENDFSDGSSDLDIPTFLRKKKKSQTF